MEAKKYLCLIGLLLTLLHPAPAAAQVTFYVLDNGDQGYIIEADDINAGAGVEITVVYDSNLLARPQASLTQGRVTEVFDAVPGTVVIRANQGDDASQTFDLHLSFDRIGAYQGGIFSVEGKVLGPDGTSLASRTLPSASTPAVLPSVSCLPEPAEATDEGAENGDLPLIPGQSVLQRFQDFRGERGLRAYAALFRRNLAGLPVQEPAVALSDGKTPVRITLPEPAGQGDTPDIALSDAKLLRCGKAQGEGWEVTALPSEGTWSASLLISSGVEIVEFPLVVVPPIALPDGVSEKNFLAEMDRFLAAHASPGKGEGEAPRRTLLEYVFTANYLVHSGRERRAASE